MAAVAVRVLRSVLYGVAPGDLPAFGSAILAVAAIAVVAAWLPARAIAGVDPSRVIRDK